jgi:hypothetical protein
MFRLAQRIPPAVTFNSKMHLVTAHNDPYALFRFRAERPKGMDNTIKPDLGTRSNTEIFVCCGPSCSAGCLTVTSALPDGWISIDEGLHAGAG